MTTIRLEFIVHASCEKCFDLSRSIDLHMVSTAHTGEKAIAGRTSGLIELGETVTWRAKHIGIWQKLTSKITQYNYPHSFTDEMVKGAFKSFHHQHIFEPIPEGCKMTDIFTYEVPFGFIGRLFDKLVLRSYMEKLLIKRNETIKQYAENGEVVNL